MNSEKKRLENLIDELHHALRLSYRLYKKNLKFSSTPLLENLQDEIVIDSAINRYNEHKNRQED